MVKNPEDMFSHDRSHIVLCHSLFSMGKKKRRPKRSTDDVIVIDLNDEDNSSDELEADHKGQSSKSKKDSGSTTDIGTKNKCKGHRAKVHNDDDDSDCIDLTEQDAGAKENDGSSEEIVLIDEDDGETEKKKRRKLPAYAEYRQGLGFVLDNLRAEASGEVGNSKRTRTKKQRSNGDERSERRNWRDDSGSWRKQDKRSDDKGSWRKRRSPERQDWRSGARDRPERSHRSPERYTDKDRTSEYRKDLKQSPRKHDRDINYRENTSPESAAREEIINIRQSPRKRRQCSSREWEAGKEQADDIDGKDMSRSPLNKKKERSEKNGDLEERNGSKSNGSRMRFEKGQRKWEKVPVNRNAGSARNIQHVDTDRNGSKDEHYADGTSKFLR